MWDHQPHCRAPVLGAFTAVIAPCTVADMQALVWLIVAAAAIFAFGMFIDGGSVARGKRLAETRAEYDEALARLRGDPTSAFYRQRALEVGRALAALSRESGAVTVFDEMALKNDLDAAAAGATVLTAPIAPAASKAPATPAPAAGAPSVADRLRLVADLRTQGLISEEELQARRSKILEGV